MPEHTHHTHQWVEAYIGYNCAGEGCDAQLPPGAFDPPELAEEECQQCGAYYNGGICCGNCGDVDPLNTGEFDPWTGEQW